MTHLLVRHKVADFPQWKKVFDSHKEAQGKAGLKLKQIFRSLADSNEVFLLFEVSDLEKAKAFLYSPEVPKAKEESGVIDQPDIYFLGQV